VSCELTWSVIWDLVPVTWAADAPLGARPLAAAAPEVDAAAADAPGHWASQLVAAFRAGRIRAAVMWDVLLTHIDANSQPDVGSLLEHLPEPQPSSPVSLDDLLARLEMQDGAGEGVASAQDQRTRHESDDWFVMVDGHDAA